MKARDKWFNRLRNGDFGVVSGLDAATSNAISVMIERALIAEHAAIIDFFDDSLHEWTGHQICEIIRARARAVLA